MIKFPKVTQQQIWTVDKKTYVSNLGFLKWHKMVYFKTRCAGNQDNISKKIDTFIVQC